MVSFRLILKADHFLFSANCTLNSLARNNSVNGT
jgi:hypothetical protein